MNAHFDDIACASLPLDAWPQLAAIRCEPGVQVASLAGRVWVRFEPGNERVLQCLFALHAVELFAFRDGAWRRFGQSIPAFDFPRDLPFEPLFQVLFPAPVLPIPPGKLAVAPLPLTLKRDDQPRPTSAMLCPLPALLAWADCATTVELERLHGVIHQGQILVIGKHATLPAGGERFWGTLVLVPLGFAPAPALPEAALREAAGVGADELLLLRHDGMEAVPRTAFAPLTRAALRLAEGLP